MVKPMVVLLIKTSDSENGAQDEYASFFSLHQIPSVLISPIDFSFVNQNMLEEHIIYHSDRYWALVLTSPRAAKAVRNVFDANKHNPLIELWSKKKFYAVGPATANIMPYSDKTITPTKDFNAHGLVNECILKDFLKDQNETNGHEMFFPCGDLALDNLPNMLSEVAVPCYPCVVYKTVIKSDFESQFRQKVAPWMSHDVHFCVAFFSSSCFKNSIHVIERCLELEKFTFVAIGKQTQSTINSYLSARDSLVCLKPTPQGMLDVINKLNSQI